MNYSVDKKKIKKIRVENLIKYTFIELLILFYLRRFIKCYHNKKYFLKLIKIKLNVNNIINYMDND